MSRLLTVFSKATGRVVFEGFVDRDSSMDQAENGHLFTDIKPGDKIQPSPRQVWVVDNKRLPRAEVDPDRMADGLAEEAKENATQSYYEAVDKAVRLAPRPAMAAKATQATFALLLPMVNKLALGQALTPEEQATLQSLADLFANATSALPEGEAIIEIRERLGEADAAAAKLAEFTAGKA